MTHDSRGERSPAASFRRVPTTLEFLGGLLVLWLLFFALCGAVELFSDDSAELQAAEELGAIAEVMRSGMPLLCVEEHDDTIVPEVKVVIGGRGAMLKSEQLLKLDMPMEPSELKCSSLKPYLAKDHVITDVLVVGLPPEHYEFHVMYFRRFVDEHEYWTDGAIIECAEDCKFSLVHQPDTPTFAIGDRPEHL